MYNKLASVRTLKVIFPSELKIQNVCKFAIRLQLYYLRKQPQTFLISVSRDSYQDRVEGLLNYKPKKKRCKGMVEG